MAAYITVGRSAKCLLAPQITAYPAEWRDMEAEAEKLEAELEELRSRVVFSGKHAVDVQEYQRIRQLRKQLAKIDRRSARILEKANPAWFAYWRE